MNEFLRLQKEQTCYLHKNLGHLLENDCVLNDLNRKIIAALKESTKKVFIGSINCSSPDPAAILKEYTGQTIYNFECDFCIPSFDESLVELIVAWNRTNKIEVLDKIHDRIESAGGTVFIWT